MSTGKQREEERLRERNISLTGILHLGPTSLQPINYEFNRFAHCCYIRALIPHHLNIYQHSCVEVNT